MTKRQIIVVDVETTGLDPRVHDVVEVAWWNLDTGGRGAFVPVHIPGDVLSRADIKALRINGYLDRLADAEQDVHDEEGGELFDNLDGNVLAGSNPTFDAAFLTKLAIDRQLGASGWHHRLLDLSAYAAGVLGMSPAELPGLSTVCEWLNVVNDAPHTAVGDVLATGQCFQKLMAVPK